MTFKFVIPVTGGIVSDHFGHAKDFCFIEVDDKVIGEINLIASPGHNHGMVPDWILQFGVTHVLANGIGQKAVEKLTSNNVEVIWGVPPDKPELLVKAYLDSQLTPGVNLCDH